MSDMSVSPCCPYCNQPLPLRDLKDFPIVRIQRAVAGFYQIKVSDLVGVRRLWHVVRARQVAMYLCRELLPGHSFPQIARRFNRDYTTVIFACNAIAKRQERELVLASEICELRKSLG